MPTNALYFTAVGTLDDANFIVVAGSFPTILKTNDGDTSYLRSNDNAISERYTLDNLPAAAAGGTVSTLTAIWAARKTVNNVLARVGIFAPTYFWSATQTVSSTPGYTAYSLAVSGGPWTVAAVNAGEGAVQKTNDGADTEFRLTQAYLSAAWTPVSGGWRCLVSGIGPLLGAGLTLGTALQIAAWHNQHSPSQIARSEAPQLLQDLQEWTRPVSVLVGERWRRG